MIEMRQARAGAARTSSAIRKTHKKEEGLILKTLTKEEVLTK
jgi:hypothetical protein